MFIFIGQASTHIYSFVSVTLLSRNSNPTIIPIRKIQYPWVLPKTFTCETERLWVSSVCVKKKTENRKSSKYCCFFKNSRIINGMFYNLKSREACNYSQGQWPKEEQAVKRFWFLKTNKMLIIQKKLWEKSGNSSKLCFWKLVGSRNHKFELYQNAAKP